MTTKTTSPSKLARNAREYRTWIRRLAGRSLPAEPVVVVEGDVAPRSLGEGYRYTTRTGRPVYYPSAYARSGWSSLVYHRSTNRTEVGAAWLAARGISVAEVTA